jgi:uncharacterized membrane protein YqhA
MIAEKQGNNYFHTHSPSLFLPFFYLTLFLLFLLIIRLIEKFCALVKKLYSLESNREVFRIVSLVDEFIVAKKMLKHIPEIITKINEILDLIG